MEVQLKKGLIEVYILSILKKHDSYGYELLSEATKYIDISESTLYPILKRLIASEYATSYTVEHNSRLRKYYRITRKGKDRIQDFLKDWDQVELIISQIREEDL
ncbi:MAG: PadR family transcriptional regulator [Oscillospiraceae bacterium]